LFFGSLVLIFAGFTTHAGPMIFSSHNHEPAMSIETTTEHEVTLENKTEIDHVSKGEVSYANVFIMSILLVLIFLTGLTLPAWLITIIKQMAVPFIP